MKNEEKHIEKCLKALVQNGFGDNGINGEIILVDTGSTDNSLSIAGKYLNKIYHFDWVNDFSKAKNYSISLAQYKYVLIIDADEYMTTLDKFSIQQFMDKTPNYIGQIKRFNQVIADGIEATHIDYTERLFNKNLFHFKGTIHEQVVPINPVSFDYTQLNICIDHDGYLLSQEQLNEKAARNNILLFEQLKKEPYNPYIHFQIGQSYMMMRDIKSAAENFANGLACNCDPTLEYVQMMITSYGTCLLDLEEYDKALSLLDYYDEFASCAEFVFMAGNIYLNTNQPILAYKEYLRCLSMKNERTVGTTSFFPLHNIGVINEMLGDSDSAISFYQKAADLGYERSKNRLKELLNK